MSIRKSLLAVITTALTMAVFAAPALAITEDRVVDVNNGTGIPAGRELHLVGWAKFSNATLGGMECHVTAVIRITGNSQGTGHVSTFAFTDTTKCTGSGFFSYLGCNELTSHTATTTNALNVHIWDVTATENDFKIYNVESGNMVFHLKPKGTCVLAETETTLTFPEITLRPLKTGNMGTGTGNLDKLGGTAATGEPIAGFEISGAGESHNDMVGTTSVTASGELELTEADRCTWKFAAG